MSVADWYLHKARQCERMAKEATHPQRRDVYKQEKILWLEIAAAIMPDTEQN